jgi:hypothetical protein
LPLFSEFAPLDDALFKIFDQQVTALDGNAKTVLGAASTLRDNSSAYGELLKDRGANNPGPKMQDAINKLANADVLPRAVEDADVMFNSIKGYDFGNGGQRNKAMRAVDLLSGMPKSAKREALVRAVMAKTYGATEGSPQGVNLAWSAAKGTVNDQTSKFFKVLAEDLVPGNNPGELTAVLSPSCWRSRDRNQNVDG